MVDLKLSFFVTGGKRLSWILVLAAGAALITVQWILGSTIAVVSLAMITTQYRLRIDTQQKRILDYVWIAGLRIGNWIPYQELEYIYVKAGNISQTMQLRVASTTVKQEVFNIYLKVSERVKIHLYTAQTRKEADEFVERVSQQTKLPVVDYAQ